MTAIIIQNSFYFNDVFCVSAFFHLEAIFLLFSIIWQYSPDRDSGEPALYNGPHPHPSSWITPSCYVPRLPNDRCINTTSRDDNPKATRSSTPWASDINKGSVVSTEYDGGSLPTSTSPIRLRETQVRLLEIILLSSSLSVVEYMLCQLLVWIHLFLLYVIITKVLLCSSHQQVIYYRDLQ